MSILAKSVALRRHLLYRATQRYVSLRTGGTVLAGPFKGLRFPANFPNPVTTAYLMGMYELEVHPFLSRMRDASIQRVINVGAASGFYAAGLAVMLPDATVIAFEGELARRTEMDALLRWNRVNARVEIRGFCQVEDFAETIARAEGPTLVVMDVEGMEEKFLAVEFRPALAQMQVLVETHDFAAPGSSVRIKQIFDLTHHVEEVPTRDRTPADLPFRCPHLLHRWLLHVASDQRGPAGSQSFITMTPRARE